MGLQGAGKAWLGMQIQQVMHVPTVLPTQV
jgi:hypothetical protein